MITFSFNTFPISINKLYSNRFGQKQRFLTTEGRAFKAEIDLEVKEKLKDPDLYNIVSSLQMKPLEVTIDIFSKSWLLKDQTTIRIKDIANCEKALLDSIFSAINQVNIDIDDSAIWKLTLNKHFVLTEDITIVTIQKFEGTV